MLLDTTIIPVKGDLPRKWISDDFFDLIVWYEGDVIAGFQLCYDKPYSEHAFTWLRKGGCSHALVDSGDDSPTTNRTPILVANGRLPKERIIAEFYQRSLMLSRELRWTVLEKLGYSPEKSPVP